MAEANADAESIVRREFQKLFPEGRDAGSDNVPLADLGIDSLDFFEQLLLLEEEHGITVDISELDNDLTLKDLLSSLRNGGGE